MRKRLITMALSGLLLWAWLSVTACAEEVDIALVQRLQWRVQQDIEANPIFKRTKTYSVEDKLLREGHTVGIQAGYTDGVVAVFYYEIVGRQEQLVRYEVQIPLRQRLGLVLDEFMTAWQSGLTGDMVPLTAPSWRAALAGTEDAAANLYGQFGHFRPEVWAVIGEEGLVWADEATAQTLPVQITTLNLSDEGRQTYRYEVVLRHEGGAWYVDPTSLAAGERVNMTVSASPSETELYYNKQGGKYYHADANCPVVDKRYLPLQGVVTYGQLNDPVYENLVRCERCDAPTRVEQREF